MAGLFRKLSNWFAPAAPEARLLQRDQIVMSVRSQSRSLLTLAATLIGIAATALLWREPLVIVGWLCTAAALTGITAVINRHILKHQNDLTRFFEFVALHIAGSLGIVVSVCTAGLLFWVSGDSANNLFILLLLTVSASLGTVISASYAPASALNGLYLATSAAICFGEGTASFMVLGGFSFAVSAMLTGVGLNINEMIAEMLRLRHSERKLVDDLREANRAKSEFLANMSHELRTPLNAVIGFSDVMRQEMLGPVGTPAYLGYAADIHSSGEHLLSLINDILDLSKIEAGKFELRESEFDMGEIVAEAHRIVMLRAQEGNVTLINDVPTGIIIRADETAIRQVALNVAMNAIKFTRPGGSVRSSVEALPDGRFATLVTDTGVGIDPKEHEHVFEVFGQGRHDIASKERGTGLGLPIVRSLMRAHDGDATLESVPGTGTTVRLILPASRVLRIEPRRTRQKAA